MRRRNDKDGYRNAETPQEVSLSSCEFLILLFFSKVKVLLNLRGVNHACPGSRIGDFRDIYEVPSKEPCRRNSRA